jgi:hypothetical protein
MPSDTSSVTVSSGRASLATFATVSLFPRVGCSFRTRSGIHLSFRAEVSSRAFHFISDIHFSDAVVSSGTESTSSFTASSLL